MGCGSSTAAGTLGASLERDPEDLIVDQFKLNRVAVPAFDEWFDKLEAPVNEVIGMSNKLNDMVTEILVAGALVSGGYTLKLETEGVVSHDHVLLSLVKADGTTPTAEEVDAAAKKPEVAKADTDLAAARAALHSELNSAQVALSVAPDGKLAPAGGAVDRLNAAVAEFNKVAAPLKVTLVAKKSPAPGARTFSAKLIKPHFKPSADNMNDSSVPEEHTLTLLDAAKTATGKQILACESLAVDQSFQVAVACKDAADLSIKVAETSKYRITVTHAVTDEKKKAAIDKAVTGANIATFKLLKALYTIKGPITLGTALVNVVKSVFQKAERLAGDAVKKAIKFDVKFAIKEDHSIDFDFKPEFPNTNWAWPEILPGPAKLAMNTVLALIEEIKTNVGTFQTLQEKVNALIEESKELFADPGTKFQEAGLDMMAASKAAASLARNTAKITGSATVVAAFLQTVQRVAAQLQETVTAIPKEVEALSK